MGVITCQVAPTEQRIVLPADLGSRPGQHHVGGITIHVRIFATTVRLASPDVGRELVMHHR
ncbi:hypothetical protein [Streptomyces sp. NPDC097610]|uniref:hypothetical protein n=1 Tax=Streptomyces sp. NPDC097610 TaxID=3157227 RepID=UPI003320E3BF